MNPTFVGRIVSECDETRHVLRADVALRRGDLLQRLNELRQTEPHITDVRGRGLMIGIELDVPQKEVRQRLIYDEHCFVGCSGTHTLRLLPPLCLSRAEADEWIQHLTRALR